MGRLLGSMDLYKQRIIWWIQLNSKLIREARVRHRTQEGLCQRILKQTKITFFPNQEIRNLENYLQKLQSSSLRTKSLHHNLLKKSRNLLKRRKQSTLALSTQPTPSKCTPTASPSLPSLPRLVSHPPTPTRSTKTCGSPYPTLEAKSTLISSQWPMVMANMARR